MSRYIIYKPKTNGQIQFLLIDKETDCVVVSNNTNSVKVYDGQRIRTVFAIDCISPVPTDAVDKLLKKMHMLSATLTPYFNEGKDILVTPMFDNNYKPIYYLNKSNSCDEMVSIINDNVMSFDEYALFAQDTSKPYEDVLSNRIANVYQKYKNLLNELFNRYGNVCSNH